MTRPYKTYATGSDELPSTDGVPNGYTLFYDASSGEPRWGKNNISTTGANNNDILTYRSSTNSIVWSSPNINILNFINFTQSLLLKTFFGAEAGGQVIGCDINYDGTVVVLGYPSANTNTGLVRVFAYDSGTNQWNQVGTDLTESGSNAALGEIVCMSKNSTSSQIRFAARCQDPHIVRVYDLNGTTWTTTSLQPTETGNTPAPIRDICISDDGNRIIASEYETSGTYANHGVIAVFDYSGAWTKTQLSPFTLSNNSFAGSRAGKALSISGDGNRLVIGAPKHSSNGAVLVYDYANGVWGSHQSIQHSAPEEAGSSVTISSDGTTLAFGIPLRTVSNNTFSGRVVLWRVDNTGQFAQEQIFDGNFLSTVQQGTFLGIENNSISLSSNGRRIAIGVPNEDSSNFDTGHLYIVNKSSTTNLWAATSDNIIFSIPGDSGESTGAKFGFAVAMSRDGERVIASAINDDNQIGNDAGLAKLYGLPDNLASGSIYHNTDYILRIVP